MSLNTRRGILILASMLITFIVLRVYLHLYPGTNLDVGTWNVHHLFTGLLLITLGGLPLAMFHGNSTKSDIASILFGAGLGMALDEWVYLIVTDGSDMSYLRPVSLWGGVAMIGLATIHVITLLAMARRCASKASVPDTTAS